jgi:hypothetical protein
VGSQIALVLIGVAAGFIPALILAILNNRHTLRLAREQWEHDMVKERTTWAMEHNLSIYAEFLRAAKQIVRLEHKGDEDSVNAEWNVFYATLEQIRLVGSSAVRDAADEYSDTLLRHDLALSERNAPPEQRAHEPQELTDIVRTTREAREVAENHFLDAVRRERGEPPVVTDAPNPPHPWWRGGRWLSKGV